MLLPQKAGHFTLLRRIGADAVTERFVAILDEPAGKQVVARRVHPVVARDPVLMDRIRARVDDLQGVRHPALARIEGVVEVADDVFVLEEWVEGVDLGTLLQRGLDTGTSPGTLLPHNVFLDFAAQVCNALEGLHARPGVRTGIESVLHLGLLPETLVVRPNGQVVLVNPALVSTPTILPQHANAATQGHVEYLAPEQTHPDQPLSPATDVFVLGSLLYELLTLKPLFRADTNLQTIHRVRRAEVTTQLLEIKELLPGLDRVLYRALSLNPRHRYQRAFVLREDLRGLMAGFSFADIERDARRALAPVLGQASFDEVLPEVVVDRPMETTGALLDGHAPAETWQETSDLGPVQVAPMGTLVATEMAAALASDLGDTTDTHPGADDTLAYLRAAQRGEMLEPELEAPRRVQQAPLPQLATEERALSALDTQERPSPYAQREQIALEATQEQPSPPAAPTAEAIRAEIEAEARAAEAARKRLAPPDSLVPPASEPPAPLREVAQTPTLEDRELPGPAPTLPWVPIAIAASLAAVLVLGCLGVGGAGGALGIAGWSRGADNDPVVAAAAPSPEPTPAAARPIPVAERKTERKVETQAAAPNRPGPAPAAAPPSPRSPDRLPDPPAPRPSAAPPSPPAYVPPPPPPEPAAATYDAVAFSDDRYQAEQGSAEAAPSGPLDRGQLEALSAPAFSGRLSSDDRARLAGVATDDPLFTRAHTLLYLDAKATGDAAGRDAALARLMALPENQYNPALLVEEAWLAMGRRDWPRALERAEIAERHWARLPSDLIFSRKALIYEIQAQAHLGRFYASEGESGTELDLAIKGWQKYRRHAETQARTDLMAVADQNLAKLYDIQRRLE